MTNQSPRPHITDLPSDLTIRGLSAELRNLVELMREYQFGRIENMAVRAGQPILNREVRLIRIARLGSASVDPRPSVSDDFQPKRAFRDLFDAFERLNNGIVIKLEFRHGLPFLLEALAS